LPYLYIVSVPSSFWDGGFFTGKGKYREQARTRAYIYWARLCVLQCRALEYEWWMKRSSKQGIATEVPLSDLDPTPDFIEPDGIDIRY
jgi:hypothetical protein